MKTAWTASAIAVALSLGGAQCSAADADPTTCAQFRNSEWSNDELTLWREFCDQSQGGSASMASRHSPLKIGRLFLKRLFTSRDSLGFVSSGPLHVHDAIFADGLDLADVNIRSSLTLSDSVVHGIADLSSSTTAGSLTILRGRFDSILARAAIVQSSLIIGNFARSRQLPVDPADPIEIGDLDLSDASVARDVVIVNARIAGDLTAVSLSAGAAIAIGRVQSGRMKLANAIATQEIDVVDSAIHSAPDPFRRPAINFFSARTTNIIVSRDTIASENEEDSRIALQGASISGGLYLTDTNTCAIDARDMTAKVAFSIVRTNADKQCDVALNLRNATVQLLSLAYWSRKENDLYGLRVDDIAPDMIESSKGAGAGDVSLSDWLATTRPYSPEPYERFGKLLAGMGYDDLSRSVYYANRQRQLEVAWAEGDYFQSGALFGYWLFVGYGLRPEKALFWAAALVVLGSLVLRRTELEFDDPRFGPVIGSLDLLVPIISLNDKPPPIPKPGAARFYVYAHKIMGYLLSSYVIAALGLGR